MKYRNTWEKWLIFMKRLNCRHFEPAGPVWPLTNETSDIFGSLCLKQINYDFPVDFCEY